MERWATFDCYGTLVDWNAGIRAVVGDELLPRYHELEPQVEHDNPTLPYRGVLREVAARLGVADPDALPRSLPEWPVFPEVRESLEEARRRGWKLAILSNTDRDFIEASMSSIGVPFEFAIVASEIGSYKPAHKHWETFAGRTGAPRSAHAHVAASLYHDIAPATELGLRTVWINRLGEEPEPKADVELHSLTGLGDALDSLA